MAYKYMYFVTMRVKGQEGTPAGWYPGNTEEEAMEIATKSQLNFVNKYYEPITEEDIEVVEIRFSGNYDMVMNDLKRDGK